MKHLIICLFAAAFALTACRQNPPQPDVRQMDWEQILQTAKGSTVNLMMWQGDPLINRYMSDWVKPELKKRFDIQLQISPGQGTEIVKVLLAEKEARAAKSALDICWINGETFYQLRQIDALYGPFTNLLPNAAFIDFDNPFIGIDFQQPVDGYECPWGNVQLALIYDTLRTPQPPQNLQQWEQWFKANPGKFTIPAEFTGMTLLKSWMAALAGSRDALDGPFNEQKYRALSDKLWDFINKNKTYFWKQGKTFPESLASMHQMFANGELDFTMSNNDNEVDNKILQHVFPETARAYVPEIGTIQNSHYLGIPRQAVNKAGALAVINFLISPEAQAHKLNPGVWGDGTVLNRNQLPAAWQPLFDNIPGRRFAPPKEEIRRLAIKEPAPEYMIRLYADFREKVIRQ